MQLQMHMCAGVTMDRGGCWFVSHFRTSRWPPEAAYTYASYDHGQGGFWLLSHEQLSYHHGPGGRFWLPSHSRPPDGHLQLLIHMHNSMGKANLGSEANSGLPGGKL